MQEPPQQKQSQVITQQTAKLRFQQASTYYNNNEYQKAQQIYSSVIGQCKDQSSLQLRLQALRNRSSVHMTMKQFQGAVADLEQYLKLNQKETGPQIYVYYITALIKSGEHERARNASKQALQKFPYHKKLQQITKLSKQKHIANDEDLYLQHMFQKLCAHPKLRQYLKQQSFLTKVERLIRNPSLGPALQKMDPRIRQAADILMMAQQNWQ